MKSAKVVKVILGIVVVLCGTGIGVSYLKDNLLASYAWLSAMVLALGWLGQISALENALEDSKFWKRNFVNAQERYARSSAPDENA